MVYYSIIQQLYLPVALQSLKNDLGRCICILILTHDAYETNTRSDVVLDSAFFFRLLSISPAQVASCYAARHGISLPLKVDLANAGLESFVYIFQ